MNIFSFSLSYGLRKTLLLMPVTLGEHTLCFIIDAGYT